MIQFLCEKKASKYSPTPDDHNYAEDNYAFHTLRRRQEFLYKEYKERNEKPLFSDADDI